MQFHLNGFQAGDPHIDAGQASERVAAATSQETNRVLPDEVDVLIVGCGPAGLTLAAQLSQFADISTAIIETKPGPLILGQADGIACRTMEMFEAFNFSERVLKEACWINEVTFWRPDPRNPSQISRQGRIRDTEEGLSEFPHVVLNQARVHDFYLETMRNAPGKLSPVYDTEITAINRSDSGAVTVDVAYGGMFYVIADSAQLEWIRTAPACSVVLVVARRTTAAAVTIFLGHSSFHDSSVMCQIRQN